MQVLGISRLLSFMELSRILIEKSTLYINKMYTYRWKWVDGGEAGGEEESPKLTVI